MALTVILQKRDELVESLERLYSYASMHKDTGGKIINRACNEKQSIPDLSLRNQFATSILQIEFLASDIARRC